MRNLIKKSTSIAVVLSVALLSACGGSSSSAEADASNSSNGATNTATAVPAAWVGSWINTVNCYSYLNKTGGGNYYLKENVITITSDGSFAQALTTYNDQACTSKAGVVTRKGVYTNRADLSVADYTSVANVLSTETSISIGANGGTGISSNDYTLLNYDVAQGLLGINASAQLCGREGDGAYPTTFIAGQTCFTKQ